MKKLILLAGLLLLLLSLPSRAENSELTWGLRTIRAPEAWALDARRGQGARVLVLDSGVDAQNPEFAGRVEAVKDFAGGFGSKGPDAHGTHIAGTIAAADDGRGVVGVAPRATILSARVCTKSGCSPDAILKALRWAVAEKVDVLNISLDRENCPSAMKAAIQAAEDAGVVVVAAAGNLDQSKLPCPANLPTVISVGAVDQKLNRAHWKGKPRDGGSNYGPELTLVAPGDHVLSTLPVGTGFLSRVEIDGLGEVESLQIEGSPATKAPLRAAVVDGGLGKSAELRGRADLRGKILLLDRGGGLKFREKAANAMAAGAIAVLVANTEEGLYPGVLNGRATLPIVMIERQVAERIRTALAAGPVTAQFSVEKADYGFLSGTSMAAPHVVGLVALLRAANKSLTPARIREILRQSARPLASSANEFGAGIIDAAAALQLAR